MKKTPKMTRPFAPSELLKILAWAAVLAWLSLTVLFVLTPAPVGSTESQSTGLAAIRVPEGFTVQQAATSELVDYPMFGELDDRGRLFLALSSGNNLTNQQMAQAPEFSIRVLEDVDGDGIYDGSSVFADTLTFPAGLEWHRGSLYVASPPDFFRLDDRDGDGRADHRETILSGWNLSSNAASLHGPFLGPDGWFYLTDGRHGYKIKTREGTVLEGKASRIWRCRPDGSGLEWVSGGGFDNPVEIAFTAAGETIGTMTYFTDPKNGQRDALLHFVEGGVYPKWHPVVSEFRWTGNFMPVMTKFARIAPSGLLRYRSRAFGPDYEGNLFTAQFNPHRVQRHRLFREGATFRTEDEDFLTSADPDFHPTDLVEDADGSLLIIDTGGWFLHGCPVSRVAKPEIKGAVYRVRKKGVPVEDPRGEQLKLSTRPAADLAAYLHDTRPAIRDRALDLLVEQGDASVEPLARVLRGAGDPEGGCAAVFGLSRMGTPEAMKAVRAALRHPDFLVRIAAARAVGLARDTRAVDPLLLLLTDAEPAVRRQVATALGQIGQPRTAWPLLAAAAGAQDRFVEHAIIYSLILFGDSASLTAALQDPHPATRKAALIALDQRDRSSLRPAHLTPFLNDASLELRRTALWVATHHPDWSPQILAFLNSRLRAPRFTAAEDREAVRETLLAFCSEARVQALLADLMQDSTSTTERLVFLLDIIDRCSLTKLPDSWIEQLRGKLRHGDMRVRARVLSLVRSRRIHDLDEPVREIAANNSENTELRVAALGILIQHRPLLDEAGFSFLLTQIEKRNDPTLRLSAAQILAQGQLTESQLLNLSRRALPQADSLVLPTLLDAFRSAGSPEVGAALVAALLKTPLSPSVLGADRLTKLLQNFPAGVREAARPLWNDIEAEREARVGRLKQVQSWLTGGDVGRGRRVFFGSQAACSSCHTIGLEGKEVGPDLTAVGAVRSSHDLLEAILFPSASFVPGHEVHRIQTAREVYSGVIIERTADAVVLVTGPDAEVRIPRSEILSMEPSRVSIMPEGLDRALTQQELIDLLAFLQSQK